MPQRISRAEFEKLKAAQPSGGAPKRVTRAEFEAMGGKVSEPPRTVAPEVLPGGVDHGPVTAGLLNALDSASIVGLPAVLAAGDVHQGPIDAAKTSFEAITGDKRGKVKALLDRYYASKGKYQAGMDRLADTNPKAAVAGQLAPALIPGGALAKGATLGKVAKYGLGTGVVMGAARGPAETLRFDKKAATDTLRDTAVGGGVGLGAALIGAAGGKIFEKAGKLAERGMGKVMGKVKSMTRSDLGKHAKKIQEAVGGVENLWNRNKMLEEGAAPMGRNIPVPKAAAERGKEYAGPKLARQLAEDFSPAQRAAFAKKFGQEELDFVLGKTVGKGRPGNITFNERGAAPTKLGLEPSMPPQMQGPAPFGGVPGAENVPKQVQESLLRHRQGAAEKAIGKFQALEQQYGKLRRPPTRVLLEKNLAQVKKDATAGLKKIGTAAVMGGVGYKAAEAAGINPTYGAAAGGMGGLYAMRKASMAAGAHPGILAALMKLKPFGAAVAKLGTKGAVTPAVIYSLSLKHPEIRNVVMKALPDQKKPLDKKDYGPDWKPEQFD